MRRPETRLQCLIAIRAQALHIFQNTNQALYLEDIKRGNKGVVERTNTILVESTTRLQGMLADLAWLEQNRK